MSGRPLVINLYGGPGSGKSTTAAGIFYELKKSNFGLRCELVTEYAKEKVYDGSFNILDEQLYIFAKQLRKQNRVRKHVDVIITDSPLIMSILYNKDLSEHFNKLVMEQFETYNNWNFFLNRPDSYEFYGRTQTQEQAASLDEKLIMLMNVRAIPYDFLDCEKAVPAILAKIKSYFGVVD